MPAIGREDWDLSAFRALFTWPGLPEAARLSLFTGLIATVLSLAITTLILASWHGTRIAHWVEAALSPLLAVPHAAAAFGLAFLIAPSGWISRALSPWLTGWERPPDLLITNDPNGLALIAGLVAKEVPFLLLMSLAALPQIHPRRCMIVAQTLGYGRVTGWMKTIFPQLYKRIRLPVYAVLAYSMSVVDMAMILGPNTPPTLSVQIVRWSSAPDLAQLLTASAGALLQAALVVAALALWRLAEHLARAPARRWIGTGVRSKHDLSLRVFALILAAAIAIALFGGLLGQLIWSLSGFWSFPEVLPDQLSLKTWSKQAPGMANPALTAVIIAGTATAMAVLLTIACLEAETRLGLYPGRKAMLLLYLPLLIPQVSFLPGLRVLLVQVGIGVHLWPVVLAHLVFVLPYVFLSLSDPYRAWDTRYTRAAATLGASPSRIFWQVRLPMLLAPILTAAAIGFAVSVAQYLPTLLVGGGRITTLTTEALALSSGGNRRIIGAYALAQTALVVVGFALAILVPRLVWSNRRGMKGLA
ncbi:ABC transporter permease [Actibacterium pelagium]|uniref:ABC transporter permease n=2 Tax=Actibacterium pelagium TaxID=2029103 RepID=A0A917AAE1_9RHOB|nr:ABC transporter permease subunit [Actibacterium pelagium]GGE38753.1 ABC transporter permease [Actibacterium pelagium]